MKPTTLTPIWHGLKVAFGPHLAPHLAQVRFDGNEAGHHSKFAADALTGYLRHFDIIESAKKSTIRMPARQSAHGPIADYSSRQYA